MMSKIQPAIQFLFQNRLVFSSVASVVLGILCVEGRAEQREWLSLREKVEEAEADKSKMSMEIARLKNSISSYEKSYAEAKRKIFSVDMIRVAANKCGWDVTTQDAIDVVWTTYPIERLAKINTQVDICVVFINRRLAEKDNLGRSLASIAVKCNDDNSLIKSLAKYAIEYKPIFYNGEPYGPAIELKKELHYLVVHLCKELLERKEVME